MVHRDDGGSEGRGPRGAATVLVLAIVSATIGAAAIGCATPPRPVAPTTLAGSLPPAETGRRATATAATGAPEGPLRLSDAVFTWERGDAHGASYRWSCTVSNPSHRTVRVTLVAEILDADGRPVHTEDQTFLLGGDDELGARGSGSLAADVASRAASWRLEYWVRLETPSRRIPGAPDGDRGPRPGPHSHSIVLGGFDEMS